MNHAGFVRNYEPTLRLLLRDGHRVHIAYENNRNKSGENVLVERLAMEFPGVTFGGAAGREPGFWGDIATAARTYLDFLRYLEPDYAHADRLRGRIERYVPKALLAIARAAAALGSPGRRALTGAVRLVDRLIPRSPAIAAFMDEHPADLLLVTPLVDVGSEQVDYLREAGTRGIPTALCVASWDNLTNKGVMRQIPDRVFLWNERQKAEAVRLHGVPPERVEITGAQIFDHWFSWQPSRSREDFCRAVGLPADRAIILYLGSSFFIAPNEADFAERWMTAVRRSGDPVLADAAILIRPHPNNAIQWLGFDHAKFGAVAIWPPFGADPFSEDFKHDYFDSLYHCAAVMGINTSAQIEAGIVGRPVFTLRAPDFAHSQAGTLHFAHLANADEGLLYAGATMEEHLTQLREGLSNPAALMERTRSFVRSFVRPHGLERPAAPILAAGIEELGRHGRHEPVPDPWWTSAFRFVVCPLFWVAAIFLSKSKANIKDPVPKWIRVLMRPASRAYTSVECAIIRLGVARGSALAVSLAFVSRRVIRPSIRFWQSCLKFNTLTWRRVRRGARGLQAAARVAGRRIERTQSQLRSVRDISRRLYRTSRRHVHNRYGRAINLGRHAAARARSPFSSGRRSGGGHGRTGD